MVPPSHSTVAPGATRPSPESCPSTPRPQTRSSSVAQVKTLPKYDRVVAFTTSRCPLSITRTVTPGTGRNASYGGGVKKSLHSGGEAVGPGVGVLVAAVVGAEVGREEVGPTEAPVDSPAAGEAVVRGESIGCPLSAGSAEQAAVSRSAANESVTDVRLFLDIGVRPQVTTVTQSTVFRVTLRAGCVAPGRYGTLLTRHLYLSKGQLRTRRAACHW